MRFFRIMLLPAFALTALLPVTTHAAPIFFDIFDSNLGQGNISSGAIDSSATGTFTVTGGNVDIVGPTFFAGLCTTAPETGSCVDMDGSTPGQITSTLLTLTPGSYTLSFDLFGSERGPAASTTVTLGAFYSHVFNTASGDQFIVTVPFTVVTTTNASIVFTSNDPAGDTQGTLIDNVMLTANSSAVPEPSSMVLMGSTLLAVGMAVRRR